MSADTDMFPGLYQQPPAVELNVVTPFGVICDTVPRSTLATVGATRICVVNAVVDEIICVDAVELYTLAPTRA